MNKLCCSRKKKSESELANSIEWEVGEHWWHWRIWYVPKKKISNKIITRNEIKKVFSTLRAQSSIPFYFQWTNCTLTHIEPQESIGQRQFCVIRFLKRNEKKNRCAERKKKSPNELVHFCVSCGPAYHIPQGIFVRAFWVCSAFVSTTNNIHSASKIKVHQCNQSPQTI